MTNWAYWTVIQKMTVLVNIDIFFYCSISLIFVIDTQHAATWWRLLEFSKTDNHNILTYTQNFCTVLHFIVKPTMLCVKFFSFFLTIFIWHSVIQNDTTLVSIASSCNFDIRLLSNGLTSFQMKRYTHTHQSIALCSYYEL